MMRAVVGLVVLASLSCSGAGKRNDSIAGTWSAPAMLGYVPADSPYVFAIIDPVAQEFRDRTFAVADQKLAAAMHELDKLPKDFDRRALEPKYRALFAFFDELRGKDLKRWPRELGFDPSGRFVLYGLSV